MSTHEPRSRIASDTQERKGAKPSVADILGKNEFIWWPYRSFSKALLRTHNNLTAFMEVNRKLADEMRDIIRREQDMVMQMSEKVLRRAAMEGNGESKALIPSSEIEEIYDSAVAGIRELGKAVADAQIRSIETLRAHAKTAMSEQHREEHTPSKAA